MTRTWGKQFPKNNRFPVQEISLIQETRRQSHLAAFGARSVISGNSHDMNTLARFSISDLHVQSHRGQNKFIRC